MKRKMVDVVACKLSTLFSSDMFQNIFEEDELDSFVHGECLDFAQGLSRNLLNEPHQFVVLLAPEGRKLVIAHVVVEINGLYYDATGCNDRTSLLIDWSFQSNISSDRFIFERFENISEVRSLAKRLKCEFESDSEENVEYVFNKLLRLL
jgi:hypothetical protein